MVATEKNHHRKQKLFYLACIFLVFDYGRLQDLLHIGFLRPAMIIILVLSVALVLSGEIQKALKDQVLLIGLFIMLLGIHIPFAHNNYLAFATTRNMLLMFTFILAVVISVNSYDRIRKLVWLLIFLMVYISIYSLFHQGKGLGNYFVDENDLSLYINTWLPFPYFLYFVEKNSKAKILYLTSVLSGILAIVVSFSRGGFVGLVCMLLVAWAVSSHKIKNAALVCVIGLLIFEFGGHRYLQEMSTVREIHSGTAEERILSWKAAWAMFLDHPLGVGGNNFQVLFPRYQPPELKRGMYGRVAHSLWFTLLPELGVPGVFIYLFLLYRNIKDILWLKDPSESDNESKYLHALSLAFLASFAGFFSAASFLSVLYYPHYWYLTAILVAGKRVALNLAPEMCSDMGKFPK